MGSCDYLHGIMIIFKGSCDYLHGVMGLSSWDHDYLQGVMGLPSWVGCGCAVRLGTKPVPDLFLLQPDCSLISNYHLISVPLACSCPQRRGGGV